MTKYIDPSKVKRVKVNRRYTQVWTTLNNLSNPEAVNNPFAKMPEYEMKQVVYHDSFSGCSWRGEYGEIEIVDGEYIHCPLCGEDITHGGFLPLE